MSEHLADPKAADRIPDPDVSPFHNGEQAIQRRLGVRDKVEEFGRRGIRDFMPDQHREFFSQLAMFLIASADDQERPWASPLFGHPGFIQSPNPKLLSIAALPSAESPLAPSLREGATLGGLGIDFETRRRNRINGRVAVRKGAGFGIRVDQSFGNCAKYIQSRSLRLVGSPSKPNDRHSIRRFTHLDAECQILIARSDAFFIASQFRGDAGHKRDGLDISHRGGPPGFLICEDSLTLSWPDYRGNFFFNTLGNIELDPRCGLLILDFESGDLLQLTGHAETLWNSRHDDGAFETRRSVRFRLDQGIHARGAMPVQWSFLGPATEFKTS